MVIDCDRVTGSGVTSGLDFGLTQLSLLCGEQVAKMSKLMLEYAPVTPFNAGTLETAEPEVVSALTQAGGPLITAFLQQTTSIVAQLQ